MKKAEEDIKFGIDYYYAREYILSTYEKIYLNNVYLNMGISRPIINFKNVALN